MQPSCYHTYIRVLNNLIVGFRVVTADIFQTAASLSMESCKLVLFIMKFRKNMFSRSKRHRIFRVTNNSSKIRYKIIPRCLRTSALQTDYVQDKITLSFIRTAAMPTCYVCLYPQGSTEMFSVSVLKDGERTLLQNFCV